MCSKDKTCFWKQIARGSSEFWVSTRIQDTNLWASIIPAPGGSWYLLEDPSCHGWWFLRLHTRMQRIHVTLGKQRTQSIWSNSRRNSDGTSGEISDCTNRWQPWLEIQIPSPNSPARTSLVVLCRGWIDLWMDCIFQVQDIISLFRYYFRNKQLRKKVNRVVQNWSNPALRKLVRNQSDLFLLQCATRMESYLSMKRSGKVFLLVHRSKGPKGQLFQPRSRNWSWDWRATMIKMSEKRTEQLIGIR